MTDEQLTSLVIRGAKDCSDVRSAAELVASTLGFNGDDLWQITAAVTEACANAVTHGSPEGKGSVTIRLRAYDHCLETVVHDGGPGYLCSSLVSMPDPSSGRGRGVPLMQLYMDDVRFESGNGCRVTLVRCLQ